MPFKSKAQQRFMFAAESRGDLKKGTARRWAHETPNIKGLPEKVAAITRGFADGMSKVSGEKKKKYPPGVLGMLLRAADKLGGSADPRVMQRIKYLAQNTPRKTRYD